jgi:hypothetical protein
MRIQQPSSAVRSLTGLQIPNEGNGETGWACSAIVASDPARTTDAEHVRHFVSHFMLLSPSPPLSARCLFQQRMPVRQLVRIPGREPMANGLLADLVFRHWRNDFVVYEQAIDV